MNFDIKTLRNSKRISGAQKISKKFAKELKQSEDLALFLGMFAGDGCLTFNFNGDGNRIYPISFFNCNKEYVVLFGTLFYKLFGIKGSILVSKRNNKRDLWHFQKYSKDIYNLVNNEFEIPNGKKALKVFIPSFILNGNSELKKYFFLGYLITDGGIRQTGDVMFHSASKNLIYDLKKLIESVWGIKRQVKEYAQRGKFFSYQLTLNKAQASIILPQLPTSHNLALRWP